MNTVQKGDISEAKILARFVELGYPVLLPWSNGERYDMVIEKDGEFLRIQVKTGRVENGCIHFNTSSVDWNTSSTQSKRNYTNEIDYFSVYCPDENKCYLIPINDAPKGNMRLRITSPGNNQRSNIRWAEDYEMNSILRKFRGL